MLEHISKDLLRFGDSELLDASRLEHFNYTIKMFVGLTSMMKGASRKEAVKAMKAPVEDKPGEIETSKKSTSMTCKR